MIKVRYPLSICCVISFLCTVSFSLVAQILAVLLLGFVAFHCDTISAINSSFKQKANTWVTLQRNTFFAISITFHVISVRVYFRKIGVRFVDKCVTVYYTAVWFSIACVIVWVFAGGRWARMGVNIVYKGLHFFNGRLILSHQASRSLRGCTRLQ